MGCLLNGEISKLARLSCEDLVENMLQVDIDHSIQEQLSWKNSLYLLIQLLNDQSFGNLWLAAEYSLTADRRIDAIIFGYSSQQQPTAIIVELKQWEKLAPNIEKQKTNVNVCIGNRNEYRLHPIYQTVNYTRDLKAHHEIVANKKIDLYAIQYLHNFIGDKNAFFSEMYEDYQKLSVGFFVKGEERLLVNHLKKHFDVTINGEQVATEFLEGKYIIGQVGFNGLRSVLNQKDNAIMLADQIEISAQISQLFKKFTQNHRNTAIIIRGAAGTGKTIIGIHLLFLAQQHGLKINDMVFTFAKSRMLREVVKNEAGLMQHIPYLNGIALKDYSLVVVDEAHRDTDINKTIKSLFSYSKRPKIVVFLQDDHQRVLLEEVGTLSNYQKALYKLGIEPDIFNLIVQKRSGNQGDYVDRIHKLLFDCKKVTSSNNTFDIVLSHSLKIIDEQLLKMKELGETAKWFAPYDWPWKSRNNLTISNDIEIQDKDGTIFQKQWNPMKNQYEWYKDADETSFNQVGSVYTAQGLDYDYTGFIWYDDLRWDKSISKWVFDLTKVKDQTFVKQVERFLSSHSYSEAACDEVLEIFLNQYYVLLTRARKGIFLWFNDKDTEDHVMSVIKR